ncbi:MAG: TRAP transporter small permease [Burkholderiaceae bacterium]|nr:TRAP transporter small permease [Burkholderiaceae bacterium]
MSGFVRAMDRLSVFCAVVAAVMLALAAVIVTWSVIYRAMGASTFWEIEFSVFMMVASLFLASPYCLATNGHIGVDLLAHYLPARGARILGVVVTVIGLAVCLYLTWRGGILTFEAYERGERTESTWAPNKWLLYVSMPVGLGLTALQYVAELMRPSSGVTGPQA